MTTGWQPIETAPRDGTMLRVRGSSGPYGVYEWYGYARWMKGPNALPSRWESPKGASLGAAGYDPTHWEPAPPDAARRVGDAGGTE